MKEDQLQAQCVLEFYKRYHMRGLLVHIPNQRQGTPQGWQKLLSMGAVAGMPDLMVISTDRKVMFIEMKSATGKLSDNQKLTHKRLKDHNQQVTTVDSLDDFLSAVKDFLG